MRHDDPHAQTIEEVRQRLRQMLVSWGLIPLGLAFILMVIMSMLKPVSGAAEPEQLALGFKAVMAIGAALFLLGFYLDGRWTEAGRLGKLIEKEAGGDGKLSKAERAEHAHLAMDSLTFSTRSLTVIGLLIGLAAVLGAMAGLRFEYCLQILLLALAFQLFIFSRHPYYLDLMQAALKGELAPEPEKNPSHA